jgi:putative hydrolase of HD superfamily
MTNTTDIDDVDGRLERQFRFLLEIDRLKSIQRQNILADASRRENSAEHSWHLALLAIILAEHSPAPETVDIFKVVRMVLIHDLVEIDAGDAFLHDPEEEKIQAAKEAVAAKRIFSLLPADQSAEFKGLWEEFEQGITAEASFARALDRVQPALLHEATNAVVWAERGTTQQQILNKMEVVRQSAPRFWPKIRSIIQRATDEGKLS